MSERRKRPGPEPPPDLEVQRLTVGGSELAILSYRASESSLGSLSAAELDVLRHLLDGKSNAAVARARRTSRKTVENQIAELYRKLGVSSRGELAARFAEILRG